MTPLKDTAWGHTEQKKYHVFSANHFILYYTPKTWRLWDKLLNLNGRECGDGGQTRHSYLICWQGVYDKIRVLHRQILMKISQSMGYTVPSEGLQTTLGPDSLVFRGYFYRQAACLSGPRCLSALSLPGNAQTRRTPTYVWDHSNSLYSTVIYHMATQGTPPH